MEETVYQQIFSQVAKAATILIALPAALTPDSLASGLGLFLFLRKMNKQVVLASAGHVPERLRFLPGAENLAHEISATKHLVISLDTKEKSVDEISYQPAEGRLDIYIKPKGEEFVPADVSFRNGSSPYDLVFVLDAASQEDLGKLFEDRADIFFETPKINIDTKAANSYFGAINYVDINASSLAEMLAELFASYEDHLVDEDIATALITGIIAKTNSFQHIHTTPKAFLKASELIALGGRQQEVVKHLYKTKPLPVLRLWGRALARLKMVDEIKLLYSVLAAADFEKSGAAERDLPLVLQELLDNVSGYAVVGLLAEQQGNIRLLAALHQTADQEIFAANLELPLAPAAALAPQYKIFEAVFENTTLSLAENRLLTAAQGLRRQ